MKKLIIIFFLFLSIPVLADRYYVSTTGSDSDPGTIGQPFATWQKLNDVLTAGDTAYIRGGTYTTFTYGQKYQCRWNGLNGTVNDTIKIWAYPGETPIWDFTGQTFQNNTPYIIQINQCDYLWVRGLRITNVAQPGTSPIVAWNLVNTQHNIIEWCTVDHIGGFGFNCGMEGWGSADLNVETSNYNLFLNCDAYSNADPLSPSPYDGSNGFNLDWNGDFEVGNPWFPNTTFRGCRTWYNSDDGFDCFMGNSPNMVFENCWSFWNGYVNGIPNYSGAVGVGFKMGPQINHDLDNDTLATFVNCIAAQNTHSGFTGNYANETYGYAIVNMFNCLAYNNSVPNPPGGGLGIWLTYGGTPECTIRNCISIRNNDEDSYWSQVNDDHGAYWTESNNTWNYVGSIFTPNTTISLDSSIALTNFKSLDVSELTASRKSNGDLPDINFGHLETWSDLVEAGVDVGYPYDGSAPDIGIYWTYDGADSLGGEPPLAIELPTVEIIQIESITAVIVTVTSELISEGGGTVTERGLVWSTSPTPTTSNNKIAWGTGVAEYTIPIRGLHGGTTYYCRSYAINESGTAYGADVSFTTSVSNIVKSSGFVKYNGQILIVR